MYQAVATVAEAEKKSVKQVMLYLLNPNTDILKIRLEKKEVEAGNILFDDAIRMYENAKKLLAATTLDILHPRKYHQGRMDDCVLKFLSGCRFGQTEIGSYVISVVCPFAELDENEDYKQLSIFSDEEQCANSLTRQVTSLADLDDTDKQIYDGMTLTGSDVISAINKYWEDDTCEVVVCTKDGVNAAYNFGPTIAIPVDSDLTGMPTTDAVGLPFSGKAAEDRTSIGADTMVEQVASEGKAQSHAKICDATKYYGGTATDSSGAVVNQYLATQTGYNGALAVSNFGYISSGSNFLGSVQKDVNGTIRRITFVQK